MKIVIAPDKFKGSLTSIEFCNIVESQLIKSNSKLKIVKLPLTDGGDGLIDVVNYLINGNLKTLKVNDPFFRPVNASYLYEEKEKTAYIEMAEASGIKLLKFNELDCKNATTFGTGELILDAINNGASKIILGIGGSASNDCGIGMAAALGYRFLDDNNNVVKPIGANLASITKIDFDNIHPKLNDIKFEIACDVNNTLYGKNGSAHIYAAQKGATKSDVLMLNNGLRSFSKVLESTFNINNIQSIKSGGAAGGMGIGTLIFLNAKLISGIDLIKSMVNFDNQIIDAKWVITGEGNLDVQTLNGKVINGIINSSNNKNLKVAAFCGNIDLDELTLEKRGINYFDAVTNYSSDLNDAMQNTKKYLNQIVSNFIESQILV